jgi:hypothetical protein
VQIVTKIRDFQRQREYRWQAQLQSSPANIQLSATQCADLVREVWQRYKSGEGPRVRATVHKWRMARGSPWLITLPGWARHTLVVLHETVHALVGCWCGHGPEFMAAFLMVLEEHGFGSYGVLYLSAREAGLKVAPRAACPRPRRLTDEERKAHQREWGRRYRERKRRRVSTLDISRFKGVS